MELPKNKMNVFSFTMIKLSAIVVLSIFLLVSNACRKSVCPRENIVIGAKYLNGDTVLNKNAYFIFYDSIQLDYLDGRLVTQYNIEWHGCYEYSLIIKNIEDPDLLNAGDTLKISILSNVKDTFHYRVKFGGREAISYFFKEGG